MPCLGDFVKMGFIGCLHFKVPDVGADLIVLTGDTHVGVRGLRWVFDQDLKFPVVYVLGNHEFYRDKFRD